MRNATIDNRLMQAFLTTSGSFGILTTVCDGPRLFSTHTTRFGLYSPQSSTAAVVFLGMLKKKKNNVFLWRPDRLQAYRGSSPMFRLLLIVVLQWV